MSNDILLLCLNNDFFWVIDFCDVDFIDFDFFDFFIDNLNKLLKKEFELFLVFNFIDLDLNVGFNLEFKMIDFVLNIGSEFAFLRDFDFDLYFSFGFNIILFTM